jgi:CubicO group peptidase (beta-lactamase class C family)
VAAVRIGTAAVIGRTARLVRELRCARSSRPSATPGTTFAYSNASSHLLSAIVADATGQSTLAFARARLFGPLGIRSDNVFEPLAVKPPTPAQLRTYRRAAVAWPRDPQGYHMGFGQTKLPARDLAKLGYLYLNGGRWNGTQVVPADYVRASVQPHSKLPRLGPGGGYGYQWWTTSVGQHASFVAVGIGGQRIMVFPDLDLVVVITTDAQQQREDAEDLVGQSPATRRPGHPRLRGSPQGGGQELPRGSALPQAGGCAAAPQAP